MPGAQVNRDDEYLSVQIPVPNPQKVTYISAIKGIVSNYKSNGTKKNQGYEYRYYI